jgi:7-carboxy-7-deazaguanine synthase
MEAGSLNLVEVFWSVQGEGVCVGEPSVFVRLGECDLRCSWCDSPGTWKRASSCRIETLPGSGCFEDVANAIPVGRVVDEVARLFSEGHPLSEGHPRHSAVQPSLGAQPGLVSLTGGEPLLQPEGVRALASALRARGMRTLLETHGLLGDALDRVKQEVDVVSMDWKLASSVRRASDPHRGPVEPFHDQHEDFLRRAASVPRCYVKVVLTESTEDQELEEVCARVARVAPGTPLILQPVTPHGAVRGTPSPERLLAWVRSCGQRLPDVRLIPQTHKMLGVA